MRHSDKGERVEGGSDKQPSREGVRVKIFVIRREKVECNGREKTEKEGGGEKCN